MIQGTGSGAGKSLIAAAFCRIFRDRGIAVAPFKAQNMALNSYITADGGEIGRAQALQAEAARVPATVDMNPILLKASGEIGSQVIIRGKVLATMKAQEYYAFKKEAWKSVTSSFDTLSRDNDLIVIEGAGSPAEINLMNVDVVNMAVARYAKAPVLLVGDIDKGGVFASLFGTVKLLGKESRYIRALLINKFRGDLEILRPGLDMIRAKTGKPVIGVLPYIHNIGLPEEDGLALQRQGADQGRRHADIKVVIVRLRYISNFTDFDPLLYEPDVEMVYSSSPADIENADLVIIPGSKNTVKDLLLLRERGLDRSIRRAAAKGVQVMGMCGGYQMLGRTIADPHGIESPHATVDGLGLLDIETVFERTKTTCRSEAEIADSSWSAARGDAYSSVPLQGYEIHMGESRGDIGLFRIRRSSGSAPVLDGSRKESCWGTYLHGIFDNDRFRRDILDCIRVRKGLGPLGAVYSFSEVKDKALDALAGVVREHVDMDFVNKVAGL